MTAGLAPLLVELELEVAGSPPAALLLAAVARTWAMVQVVGALVSGLGADQLHGPDHLNEARPHVLTTMYGDWLDRAARASKLAIDAGVEERLVRVTEAQASQVAEVIRGIITELGHDADSPEVRAIAGRHLRAVAGGGTP